MAQLSFTTAARIAARELRAGKSKFFFVLLSVAIGVAALTGVRGFSSSFRATLLMRARSIMAADLSARMFQQPTPEQARALGSIEQRGVVITPVTELLSMASSGRTMDPLLVSLKAVDPARYPFYGTVEIQPLSGALQRPTLASLLRHDTVVVAEDLLIRLRLAIGDQIKLGNTLFTIAGVVTNEPDRLSGSFAAGPRVLISREGLDDSGLLAPGSHAGQRYLFKVPPPASGAPISDKRVADLKAELEKTLPESQVVDYRETNPALTQGLDRATALLSLMSLVALVLGAVGVAMAMRAHLQQRLDTIAIMKSLGASSGQILRIYLLQTLLLGCVGGLLGVVLGVGVQVILPVLLARLISVQTSLQLQAGAIFTGLTAGVVMTLLFALPPLLDIRKVRPSLILRRAAEEEESATISVTRTVGRAALPVLLPPLLLLLGGALRFHGLRPALSHLAVPLLWASLGGIVLALLWDPSSRGWAKRNPAQIGAAVLILVGLAVIAATFSDSPVVGRYFSLGLLGVLLVLLMATALVLRWLRWLLERTRLRLPSSLRHGLANLYRPGNPTAALLAALGLGVMQIMTVYLMQRSVVHELHSSTAPDLPNVFLIDITNQEIGGVRSLLAHEKSVTATPEFLPVVTSRLLAVDGVAAAQLRTKNLPKRMLQSLSLTYFDTPPPGTAVKTGAWWTAEQAAVAGEHPLIAVNERTAERLQVQIGSELTFSAQDAQFTARVVAITKADGQHAFSRAEFLLPPAVLRDLPTVWYGGVHARPDRVGELQRALYAAYPTVTVINVAAALETIRQVVLQITYVVQFLAAFSIFAGAVILASSIAGTRYRRLREIVVLKTLGATRARIATIFSIEFAVQGLVAGFVGILFANVLARALLRALEVNWSTPWLWNGAALLMTGLLTVATGWIASHRLLGQKPLEVLREE